MSRCISHRLELVGVLDAQNQPALLQVRRAHSINVVHAPLVVADTLVTTSELSFERSGAALLPRTLFTAEEVASSLALSESLVRQLTLEGSITCRRIGRLVRYAKDDIDAFVASRDERSY